MLTSPVHQVEIEAISDIEERQQLLLLLQQFGTQSEFDRLAVRNRTEEFMAQGGWGC